MIQPHLNPYKIVEDARRNYVISLHGTSTRDRERYLENYLEALAMAVTIRFARTASNRQHGMAMTGKCQRLAELYKWSIAWIETKHTT